MTDGVPPPPSAFAEILDRLRKGVDLDHLQQAAERLTEQNERMQALMHKRVVGNSDCSEVVIEVDPSYRVHLVEVSGSLTVRPSATQIADQFLAAWKSATDAAQHQLRADLKSEFGITIPTEPHEVQTAATEGRQAALNALQPALDNPLLGGLLKDVMQRSEEFVTREFEGVSGVARVRVNAIGMPLAVEIDPVAVRDIDNITLAEQLTAACQDALSQQLAAQTSLGEVPYREELDAERFKAIAEDMQKRVAELLRNR